jgi:F0F1-type ATP synthase membrane subunit b/b'
MTYHMCFFQVLSELIQTIASGEADMDAALAELDQHLAEAEKTSEDAMTQIRTLRDRLTKAVKDCCDRLETKVGEMCLFCFCDHS